MRRRSKTCGVAGKVPAKEQTPRGSRDDRLEVRPREAAGSGGGRMQTGEARHTALIATAPPQRKKQGEQGRGGMRYAVRKERRMRAKESRAEGDSSVSDGCG